MYKLYNKAFNIGVLFNILLFTVFNLLSYFAAYKRSHEYTDMMIGISPVRRFPSWGFPFAWEGTNFNIIWFGNEALNFLIIAFCGFAFGFLFRFIWSKIPSRRAELK
jgi:hypothetical protein